MKEYLVKVYRLSGEVYETFHDNFLDAVNFGSNCSKSFRNFKSEVYDIYNVIDPLAIIRASNENNIR